ncbi:MAG: transglycosylase SLT domain-containing protein [Oligoflexales bacterium]
MKDLDSTKRGSFYNDYESKKEVEYLQDYEARDDKFFDLSSYLNHKEVQRWVGYYQGKGRYGLVQALKRGEKYRPMIEAIFLDKNLPVDFYYLALIESSFISNARSHAGAVGIWQFMPATGKRYGLRVNHFVDERKDPIRASVAAASYIADLHRVFQNWFLALSAYSSGEGRVLGAIMRKETRDFWRLAEQKALPRETRNYVPKFIAAIWVSRQLESSELARWKADFIEPLRGLTVSSGVSLSEISRVANVSETKVKLYNPHLKHSVIPPGTSSYVLWLPKKLVNSSLESAIVKLRPSKVSKSYKVKKGDNLHTIARRFGTNIRSIKRVNNLVRSRIYAGQVLKIPSSHT